MMSYNKIIALTGSTRGIKTASESIVNYLEANLINKDVTIKKYRAYQIFNDKDKVELFTADLANSDLLLICSPVYVHSLPYPLISLLEQISTKNNKGIFKDKKLMAIIHSGYPKDIQREASLAICKNFADEMEMKWLGGIGFGGTPIIDGKPLEEVGGYTKWMRRSLEDISRSIMEGKEISEEARKYAKKHFPSIPLSILKILLNMRLKRMAKKNGVNLYAQPYKNKE